MKYYIIFFSLFVFVTLKAQIKTEVSIIPAPVSIVQKNAVFTLASHMVIGTPDNAEVISIASRLSKALSVPTGYNFSVKQRAANAAIQFKLLNTADKTLGTEGYQLSVTAKTVVISANKPAGLYYGMQTLLQLLPKEIVSKTPVTRKVWQAPAVEITDYPRFAWRGLMFDVSRHFFTKQEVKQFIDDMVKYKYNMLHMHLTDDEGWRIEIKSLPELTKVGAWRVKREGKYGNTEAPSAGEPKDYGGFYTQEDIKELVQYAKEQYVSIVPEVDIPGHSMAAVASYPDLSCTPGTYRVNSGEKFMDWHDDGTHSALVDNTLCPANEKVYTFLDKVFTEVAQLFPFEYIHMGGDECAKNFWEKSDAIKALMEKEGLKSMEEVQSYFVKRVQKIIQSKGKRMMGWDEILEGGLAADATVMSWRGMKGGIAAAKMNHQVVMTPNDFVYLDYYQGEATVEPTVYAGLRLNKTYQFEPVPPGVDNKYILGGQGNLWTEQLMNYRAVQYMVWPRSLAIAESVWSPKEKKNWPDFVNRVEHQFERMDIEEMKYARGMYDPIVTASKDAKGNLEVQIGKEIDDLDIYYSFDDSNPDKFYPKYSKPLVLPPDVLTLKLITYRNGKVAGKQINLPVDVLNKRAQNK